MPGRPRRGSASERQPPWPRLGAAVVGLLPPAIVTAVCTVLYSQTRHYGLLGYDAYPLIISSRVRSLADFIGSFTEKLMDGRYTDDFYRPLLNLTFAADHALWGLKPWGYQLTNVLLFAGSAWALYALARKLIGRESRIGPWVALLVLLFNPLVYEVLPAPPRRPELLCCLFMALSLALQLAPRALASRRPPLLPAIATLFAVASKESAFVLPVLSFVVVLLYSPRETGAQRWRHALLASVPHVVVLALMVAVRLAVVGGIGGHQTQGLGEIVRGIPRTIMLVTQSLLLPQTVMQTSVPGRWLAAAFVLGLALAAILQLARQPAEGDADAKLPQAVEAMIVAGSWILVFALVYAVAGLNQPWYFFLPVAGWALFAGALAESLVAFARTGGVTARSSAIATLGLLAAMLLWQSRYAPLIQQYDEWQRATSASAFFLGRTRERIVNAADGSVVMAPPLPTWVSPRTDAPAISGAAILETYSVQAWAELALPGRKVQVRNAGAITPEPVADEVIVLITGKLRLGSGKDPSRRRLGD